MAAVLSDKTATIWQWDRHLREKLGPLLPPMKVLLLIDETQSERHPTPKPNIKSNDTVFQWVHLHLERTRNKKLIPPVKKSSLGRRPRATSDPKAVLLQ